MLFSTTRACVLRIGAPLALVAATAALIGFEELRLAVVGPAVVEVRGTPLAGPWVTSPDTGRVLLPVADPGSSTRILAMVSTEGFERARELLGAERTVRIRGFARKPSSDELAEVSRAVTGRGLHLDPAFTILDTGTGRAALPAAIILFAAGAPGILTPLRRRRKQIRSRRTPMQHTSPDAPEDPLVPEGPDARTRPAPAPARAPATAPAVKKKLEAPLVALDLSEGAAPEGIEVLDPSGAAVSRLARKLARSTLASMRYTSRPLSEEEKLEIHREMQEIWDRV